MKQSESIKSQAITYDINSKAEVKFIEVMHELSLAFREKRDIRGWSQEVFTGKCPVSRSTVIATEMARGNPSLKTLVIMAETLGYRLEVKLVK